MLNISVLSVLVLLVTLTINGTFFKYIVDLEKKDNCECSKNKKRDFIKYFLITSLGFSLLSFIRISLSLTFTNVLYKLFVALFQLASLVNLVVMFLYTRELKKIECVCSEDWKRTFMSNYSLFFTVVYPVFIVSIYLLKILL